MDEYKVPLKIESVEFIGLNKTSPSFIEQIFKPVYQVTCLGELKQALHTVMQQINRLQLFKETSIEIVEANEHSDSVKLLFSVHEKKYRLKAGTEVQQNDIAFNFGGFWANVGGQGESLEANAMYGLSTSTPLYLSLKKPINGDPNRIFDVSFNNSITNRNDWMPFKCRSNMISCSYQLPLNNATHLFKLAVDWRRIFNVKNGASPLIRLEAGDYLKDSISYLLTVDKRNNSQLPSSGHYLKLYNEVSGALGNSRFVKNEFFAQKFVNLYKDLSMGICMHVGLVTPLFDSRLPILDKFHMGGPTSLRGFLINSLGPKDRKDSLGGRFITELSSHLSFPIVSSVKNIFRGHVFFNSGVLNDSFSWNDHLYASWGVGLIASLGGARFEINGCLPLKISGFQSISKPSMQVGIGMDFL